MREVPQRRDIKRREVLPCWGDLPSFSVRRVRQHSATSQGRPVLLQTLATALSGGHCKAQEPFFTQFDDILARLQRCFRILNTVFVNAERARLNQALGLAT